MTLQSPINGELSDKITPLQVDESLAEIDLETAVKVSTKYRKNTVTGQLIYEFFSTMNVIMFIYVAIVLAAVCTMLVPLITEVGRINNISNDGILGDTLRTSTRLMILESISIGCTLPTIFDVFLDQLPCCNRNKAKMTLGSMWHRIIFLSAFSIAGVLYLGLSDCYFMAYLYIILTRSKVLIAGAVTFYTISCGTITNSRKSKVFLLTPVLLSGFRIVFEAYSLVYPEKVFISNASSVFVFLNLISFLGVQIPWYYLVWLRYRRNQYKLNNEERKETVFMLAMLFSVVACQSANAISGWSKSWIETGADVLVGHVLVQIICILFATVMPARFMRKVVQVCAALFSWHYVVHEMIL